MVGRRFITVTALAGALVLIASTGTSWAHPGTGHGRAYGHTYTDVHGHKGDGQLSDGPISSVDDPSTVQHTSATSDATTSDANGQGHANGHTHSNLAAHPGKALGLYKHADTQGTRSGQRHNSPPPATTGGGQQAPTGAYQQPTYQGQAAKPGNTSDGDSGPPTSTPPTSTPPTEQPPTTKDPAALAQVLLHSNPTRFTALPMIIISMMALGICGLIGIARHRA